MPVAGLYSGLRMIKPCVVIPVYNHEAAVAGVCAKFLPSCCILVVTAVLLMRQRARHLAAATPDQITLIRHKLNRGKAPPYFRPFVAPQKPISHAVQIDADGQHKVRMFRVFSNRHRAHPALIVAVGVRRQCPWWLLRPLPDSHGGIDQYSIAPHQRFDVRLRVYPLPAVMSGSRCSLGPHELRIEVLVRLIGREWKSLTCRRRHLSERRLVAFRGCWTRSISPCMRLYSSACCGACPV